MSQNSGGSVGGGNGGGGGPDFNLPDEILAVIPTDPYDQLDLARKITSMAIAARVTKLETETGRMKQKMYEKDRVIYELEEKLSHLHKNYQETDSRLKVLADDNMKLSKERDSLAMTVRQLRRDLSKLETFKRQLMQSLNDDSSSQAEAVDIGTCDQTIPRAYPEKEEESNGYMHRSVSSSTDMGNTTDEASRNAGQKFSLTPYITPRLTPTGTPKVISTSVSPRRYSLAGSPTRNSGASSPTKRLYDGRGSLSSWYPSSQQSSAANSPPRGRTLPDIHTSQQTGDGCIWTGNSCFCVPSPSGTNQHRLTVVPLSCLSYNMDPREQDWGQCSNDFELLDDEEQEIQTINSRVIEKSKKKMTSRLWLFFDSFTENGTRKSKCKACGKIQNVPSKNGTSNMKKHLVKCLKSNQRDVKQMILTANGGELDLDSSKPTIVFEATKFRELLAAAIIMHDLPFQFVEYRAVRAIFHYLYNFVPVISRNTARADVMKVYSRERFKVLQMLSVASGRISLTSDLWTSISTDGYMCLTAHWIDDDWVLRKRILSFSFMPPPHSGTCVAEKWHELLVGWGIENKLFSFTLDNASSNDVAVGLLKDRLTLSRSLLCNGDYFHVRCCAHVLNLIVQEGLKGIDAAVVKIRDSVKYVKGSQARKQKFLESVREMKLSASKGLRQDVPTRWNSTFLMLESALYYRLAFTHLKINDSNYLHGLSDEEWVRVEKISMFLSAFYDVTCLFSGSTYPTANLYFSKVFLAHLTLKETMESDDIFLKVMSTSMWSKFSKYWSNFVTILSVASVLDPRYKLKFVDFAYRKVYGNNSQQFTEFRTKLFSLYNEYKAPSLSSASAIPDVDASSGNANFGKELKMLQEFSSFEVCSDADIDARGGMSQLESYLAEARFDVLGKQKFDILDFWKTNQVRYPEIAAMARDVLSIPISTVASESAFSVGGRVIDQFRSTLNPDSIEALICSRDWLFGNSVSTIIPLDELTEDLTNMHIHKSAESAASTSTLMPSSTPYDISLEVALLVLMERNSFVRPGVAYHMNNLVHFLPPLRN